MPLSVTLEGPAGKALYQVHRATGTDGVYRERFLIGANAQAGAYAVSVTSPLAGLSGTARVDYRPKIAKPRVVAQRVRVFDADTIRTFLAGKPQLVVAVGNDSQNAVARCTALAVT